MCKRKPYGTEALYFLRWVLSNKVCGKIKVKFGRLAIAPKVSIAQDGKSSLTTDDPEEIPDWEVEEEEIPPGLEKKWSGQARKGLQAGVCACGYPYTHEVLSCSHCGAPIELSEGVLISLNRFFLHTPMGILSIFILVLALFLILVL